MRLCIYAIIIATAAAAAELLSLQLSIHMKHS